MLLIHKNLLHFFVKSKVANQKYLLRSEFEISTKSNNKIQTNLNSQCPNSKSGEMKI